MLKLSRYKQNFAYETWLESNILLHKPYMRHACVKSAFLIKINASRGEESTYTWLDLLVNRVHDLIYAAPLVLILSTALNHAEALKNVNDVIDAAPLNTQLFRALVQVE